MPNIDDLPTGVTGAGQSYNYPNPPESLATVALVAAPLPKGHRGLPSSYGTYVDAEIAANRALVLTNYNWTNPEGPLDVALRLAPASAYNYARVTLDGRSWFLHLTPHYLNSKVTRYLVEVDPWPTYPWQLGYSMIRRGHLPVAASLGDDPYGDRYCTAPEPIAAPPVRAVRSAPVLSSDPADWTVMVIAPNDLRGNPTDFPYFEQHVENDEVVQAAMRAQQASQDHAGAPQFDASLYAVTYPWEINTGGTRAVYVPSVRPSPSSTIDGVPAGGGVYLFTVHGFAEWGSVLQGAPWVIEGLSVRMVPNWALSGGGDGTITVTTPVTSPGSPAWGQAAAIPQFRASVTTSGTTATVLSGWRDAILADYSAGAFRKLVTSAFTRVALGNGDSMIEYAPEQMHTSGVNVTAVTGAAHGEASIRATAEYNALGDQMGLTIGIGGQAGYGSSGYGRAASNTSSADLGTVNSAYSDVVQREAVRRQQALAVTLGVTNGQMQLGLIGAQTVMNAGVGAGMGSIGGPAGAAVGAVVGGGTALVTAGLSNNASLGVLAIEQDGSQDIAGYQLGASGIFSALSFRSWVQGLRAVSGASIPEGLVQAWRAVADQAFSAKITMPSHDQIMQLLSTWRRYGYMAGRAARPSRLDVMSHYSYWETEDAAITGSLPPDARAAIAAEFDAGVTVWNNLAEIGTDQSGANSPVAGVTW